MTFSSRNGNEITEMYRFHHIVISSVTTVALKKENVES